MDDFRKNMLKENVEKYFKDQCCQIKSSYKEKLVAMDNIKKY